MKKKATTKEKETTSLRLRKETLHCLETSQLQRVAGGGFKIRTPVGYDDNTDPIYDDNGG